MYNPNRDFQEFVIEQLNAIAEEKNRLEKKMDCLEHESFDRITPYFDGYKQRTEILNDHTRRLERIEEELKNHNIQFITGQNQSKKRKVKWLHNF